MGDERIWDILEVNVKHPVLDRYTLHRYPSLEPSWLMGKALRLHPLVHRSLLPTWRTKMAIHVVFRRSLSRSGPLVPHLEPERWETSCYSISGRILGELDHGRSWPWRWRNGLLMWPWRSRRAYCKWLCSPSPRVGIATDSLNVRQKSKNTKSCLQLLVKSSSTIIMPEGLLHTCKS